MSFPENCIRGIPNHDYLNNDGSVGSHLFYFKLDTEPIEGWFQNSINWQDDDSAIGFTLAQTKDDGTVQFRAGVAIVLTEEIERLKHRPMVGGLLSYERREILNNRFHGNLLLNEKTLKHTMRLIAAGLALAVARVVPQV